MTQILISHRGNINGRLPERENTVEYIDEAIQQGYNVEVDVWGQDGDLFLGHDIPQTKIDLEWISERDWQLWIHCKNLEAVNWMVIHGNGFINWFWHETDKVTITSSGHVWTYPGIHLKTPIENSIVVLPELNDEPTKHALGICSDFIEKYLEN